MESKQFSVGEALKFGWKTVKEHFLFFFLIVLVVLTIILGPIFWYYTQGGSYDYLNSLVLQVYGQEQSSSWQMNAFIITVGVIFWLIHLVLMMTVQLGFIKIAIGFVDKDKPHFWQLFSQFTKIINFAIALVLYWIIMTVGLLLLVFPGVIWGLRYMLFPYFIVDKGAGPIEALKMSAEATMGAKWDLFAFTIVAWTILMIGFAFFLVGYFAALPVVMVSSAFVYRRLSK